MHSSTRLSTSQFIEELYVQHHGWLYAWLCKKMGNHCDAADIAHETFIKLLQQQESHYRQPRSMLTTVAKNLAINFWRRKHIEQLYYETLAQTQSEYCPSAEEELIAIQTLFNINQAFNQLSSREKQIFQLSQIYELNYQQIAEKLEISLTTVKREMKQVFICCLTIMQMD
ncbi:sigma-70 family RNA polymerase sigma factor [Acinetobacter qingfengensis]|uniref:Uncharacterized protein n=1 Tax=Acinetobacter qingfengensis TaxID=1262585 RepID=A0A1E7QWI3_9GAMM|nr:sigma-70 family RNA polymerase sigma factor [Acinetobacter qingfengensis]KAA8731311.1 sigma-70 family RNA polymerase sigma factor [Acinetobacter qingfengensis]OEY91443.1 hypothetical protein BJI46_06815 [Acinetobacter qingfengensis]